MFTTNLRTQGFRLRPLELRDVDALTTYIFGNPDIVKMLAHDASTEEKCRKCAQVWCERCAIDSAESQWADSKLGGWALVELDPGRSTERFIGIRGFSVRPKGPADHAVSFIALAQSHWQMGLASEMTTLLLDYVFQETGIEAIFTEIWPLLNPRSEAVQKKLGYEFLGRHSVRESHGEERMRQIANFELWRASCASGDAQQTVLREVSIKMGQLAAEELHSKDEAADLILAKTSSPVRAIDEVVRENIQLGFEHPGYLAYRLKRPDWLGLRRL